MRLLTFSFLKNSRLKTVSYRLTRWLSANPGAGPAELANSQAESSLVQVCPSWPADEEPELRRSVLRDMRVFPDFVSEAEEASLLTELEPYLKRMRYEYDHWDNAIEGYRETERQQWTPQNEAVLQRVRGFAFPPSAELLPHAHVLDLAATGHIRPHVDAVRFCGAVIAGLCLCSSAVMRLEHSEHPHRRVDALLARRALYVMKDSARYWFSHAVAGGQGEGEGSVWRGQRVHRQRRIAIICRQQPDK